MNEPMAIYGLWGFGIGIALLSKGDTFARILLGSLGIIVGSMIIVASINA